MSSTKQRFNETYNASGNIPKVLLTIITADGQTGEDLFWMSGSLETRVMAEAGDTWGVEIRMTGEFSTPWPDKVTILYRICIYFNSFFYYTIFFYVTPTFGVKISLD